MFYTYILESVPAPKRYYVGSTDDLKQRPSDRNAGRAAYTASHGPWKLVWYCAFHARAQAEAFETYLKSASGRAFQKRHLSGGTARRRPPARVITGSRR